MLQRFFHRMIKTEVKSEEVKPFHFMDLPPEVQFIILTFLSIKDVSTFIFVSKHCHQLTIPFQHAYADSLLVVRVDKKLRSKYDAINETQKLVLRMRHIDTKLLLQHYFSLIEEKSSSGSKVKLNFEKLYRAILDDNISDIFLHAHSKLGKLLVDFNELEIEDVIAHRNVIMNRLNLLANNEYIIWRRDFCIIPTILPILYRAGAIKSYITCLNMYFAMYAIDPNKFPKLDKKVDKIEKLIDLGGIIPEGFYSREFVVYRALPTEALNPNNAVFLEKLIGCYFNFLDDYVQDITDILIKYNEAKYTKAIQAAFDSISEDKQILIFEDLINSNIQELYSHLDNIQLKPNAEAYFKPFRDKRSILFKLEESANFLQNTLERLRLHIAENKTKNHAYSLTELQSAELSLFNEIQVIAEIVRPKNISGDENNTHHDASSEVLEPGDNTDNTVRSALRF